MVLKMPHDDQYGPILLTICDWRNVTSKFQFSDENVYNFQAKSTCFSSNWDFWDPLKNPERNTYVGRSFGKGYFNSELPARKIKEYFWIMQNMFKKGFLFTFSFFRDLHLKINLILLFNLWLNILRSTICYIITVVDSFMEKKYANQK